MNDTITKIHARQILDSRGNPTIEVEVTLDSGITARASVPSGASTGKYEAVELRDGDKNDYMGKSVHHAVDNVNNTIAPQIIGMHASNQRQIDEKLIELDGTKYKSNLGANAILGVSLAIAKAGAMSQGKSLYEYICTHQTYELPMPMMNVINGGKHADSSLNIQEFMIIPVGADTFSKALKMCVEVFHNLKSILKQKGLSTAVGDEGGFAPKLESDEDAFEVILEAIKQAGYTPKKDFCLAVDVASSEMFNEAKKVGADGKYYFWKSNKLYSQDEMIDFWEEMIAKYPIVSIEDPLDEEDFDGWSKFTNRLGERVQIVGDDLFVTNCDRLTQGIKKKSANSILIKVNQIGTLSETLDAISLANDNNFTAIVSHRSGETEDTTIADIAVATSVGQIKTGAPSRTDRVAKYNQLLRIEEELGDRAKFNVGKEAFLKYIK